MKVKIGIKVVIFIAVVLLISSLLCNIEICTEGSTMCQNTGSTKGYVQWRWGGQSEKWYNESELEKFMKKHYSDRLEYDWVSYVGNRKNIIGMILSRGHGKPKNRMFLYENLLDKYVDKLDDEDKLRLYEIFRTGDKDLIDNEFDKASNCYIEFERNKL